MAGWKKEQEELTRELVGSGHNQFALVKCVRGEDTFTAIFAVPPDGKPTGRLWAKLEKQIPNHYIKISITG